MAEVFQITTSSRSGDAALKIWSKSCWFPADWFFQCFLWSTLFKIMMKDLSNFFCHGLRKSLSCQPTISPEQVYMVGGLEHFFIFPYVGNNQRGWNHQPDIIDIGECMRMWKFTCRSSSKRFPCFFFRICLYVYLGIPSTSYYIIISQSYSHQFAWIHHINSVLLVRLSLTSMSTIVIPTFFPIGLIASPFSDIP